MDKIFPYKILQLIENPQLLNNDNSFQVGWNLTFAIILTIQITMVIMVSGSEEYFYFC